MSAPDRDTDETGQLAVNVVESIILGDLHCAFRVQYVSDQGIDAQAEIKHGPTTTGRLLALQIKGGTSFFNEPIGNGWVFRFSEAKAKLWLGHALPVIVILADIDSRTAYWQRISSDTVTNTGKGYKVSVPRVNTLSSARDAWEFMASGLELRAIERYDFTLDYLPGDTKYLIERLHEDSPSKAALLAVHLAEGRRSPTETTKAILAASPSWMIDTDAFAWRALGSYALNHDAYNEAAQSFEKAAELARDDGEKGKRLLNAAFSVLHVDRDRAAILTTRAENLGAPETISTVARAYLDRSPEDAHPYSFDPAVFADTDEQDALIHLFLADDAARRGHWDEVERRAEKGIEIAREKSGPMIQLASWKLQMAASSTSPRDLSEPESLLRDALQLRRTWNGSTVDALQRLLGVLAMRGNFEEMLRLGAGSPYGNASSDERIDPRVLKLTVTGAHLLGRRDIVAELVDLLPQEDPETNLLRARVGLDTLPKPRRIGLLRSCLKGAIASHEYQAAVQFALQLAESGVDPGSEIDSLASAGIIGNDFLELMKTLALAVSDPTVGIPNLRALAWSDVKAAELLIGIFVSAGRYHEAANVAHLAATSTREHYFLILKAEALLDGLSDDPSPELADLAEDACRDALAGVETGYSLSRSRLFTYLGGRYADRGNWPEAERQIEAAIQLSHAPNANDYWRLVVTRLAQGDMDRAAETIVDCDLSPRSVEEARNWLTAMLTVDWSSVIAVKANSIALQFESEDPQLAANLLTCVITRTRTEPGSVELESDIAGQPQRDGNVTDRRPLVGEDLHRSAVQALDALVDHYGELTGVIRLQGEDADLAAQLTEMLRTGSDARSEMIELIVEGKVPLGCVTMLGRCYASALAERVLGFQIAAAADETQHQAEVSDAAATLGLPAVVEASTLMLLSQLSEGTSVIGHFERLLMTLSSKLDIVRGGVDVRDPRPSGTLYWDAAQEGLVLNELGEDQFVEVFRRMAEMEAFARRVKIEPTPSLDLFPELGSEAAPWLSAIQLAADHGVALWSDDAALRGLARSLGVPTFGTPALHEALNDRSISQSSMQELAAVIEARRDQVREFVAESVVDVPATLEDLEQQADLDSWEPRAAALLLTRASWWTWQSSPISDWRQICQRILEASGDSSVWRLAAMQGVSKAYEPVVAARMLGILVIVQYSLDPSSELLKVGFQQAREVAARVGAPDPVQQSPVAVRAVQKMGWIRDPDEVVRSLFELMDPSPE